nr:XRE family transcriptional regulator [uncultured Selenomonas sp.]
MTTWEEFLEEQLKDPAFKREYDALEGWYQEQLARQDALARVEKPAASGAPHQPRKKQSAVPM